MVTERQAAYLKRLAETNPHIKVPESMQEQEARPFPDLEPREVKKNWNHLKKRDYRYVITGCLDYLKETLINEHDISERKFNELLAQWRKHWSKHHFSEKGKAKFLHQKSELLFQGSSPETVLQ